MKKLNLVLVAVAISLTVSCSAPTLCDCLTAPGGDPSNDKPSGCKKVFEDRYGTSNPSTEAMESDYYNCKK